MFTFDGAPRTAVVPIQPRATQQGASSPLPPAAAPFPEKMLVSEPQRYGETSSFPYTATPTSGATTALSPSSTTRTFLLIQNVGDFPVWFNFGGEARANLGVMLSPGDTATSLAGGSALFDAFVPAGELYIISSGGNSTVLVTYANEDF